MNNGDVSIVLKVDKSRIKDKVLVIGFHGFGGVGHLTVKHLVKELKASHIGDIIFEGMPPFVASDPDAQKTKMLTLPMPIMESKDFILITPEFPLRENYEHVCKEIALWAIENLREAILVGGLDAKVKYPKDDRVRIAYTSSFLEKFEKLPGKPLERGIFIVGPLAILLTYFEVYNFPALTVLPYASRDTIDLRATAKAVRFIARLYGLKVSVRRLLKQASKIEEFVKEIREREKERRKAIRAPFFV